MEINIKEAVRSLMGVIRSEMALICDPLRGKLGTAHTLAYINEEISLMQGAVDSVMSNDLSIIADDLFMNMRRYQNGYKNGEYAPFFSYTAKIDSSLEADIMFLHHGAMNESRNQERAHTSALRAYRRSLYATERPNICLNVDTGDDSTPPTLTLTSSTGEEYTIASAKQLLMYVSYLTNIPLFTLQRANVPNAVGTCYAYADAYTFANDCYSTLMRLHADADVAMLNSGVSDAWHLRRVMTMSKGTVERIVEDLATVELRQGEHARALNFTAEQITELRDATARIQALSSSIAETAKYTKQSLAVVACVQREIARRDRLSYGYVMTTLSVACIILMLIAYKLHIIK